MFHIIVLFCICSLFESCVGCANDTVNNKMYNERVKSKVELPIQLNYNEDYPKKDINITDIADIEYVAFRDKDVILDRGAGRSGISISDEYIVLSNGNEGTVFIFDRDGELINKFNRKGKALAEYQRVNRITTDFKNKEIFIFNDVFSYQILVYSFEGKFKRRLKIPFPLWINIAVDYNDEYILAHFRVQPSSKHLKKDNVFYYFISKSSGELTPVNIAIKEVIDNSVIVKKEIINKNRTRTLRWAIPYSPIIRNGSDFLISDIGCDTIYINKEGLFTPFIIKNPHFINSDEPILVFSLFRSNEYTIVRKATRKINDPRIKDFLIDNYTGEIFEVNIIFEDNPRFILNISKTKTPISFIADKYSTLDYIELNENGELNGELKEFVSTLKEDDNDFLMITKFKD